MHLNIKKLHSFLFVIFLTCFGHIFSDLDVKKPRASIITSVFNGDMFIREFMEDITQQTIFNECELILINANSPGNEEKIIQEYLPKFPNIKYIKLEKDPGLYEVWNMAIKMAQADFVTNANLDDRRYIKNIEEHVSYLEKNPDIDLVYSSFLQTEHINETFEKNNYKYVVEAPEFSQKIMFKCLPGPQPVWRKSMHEKAGYFRSDFKYSGDLEMWNRAVSHGSKFKRLPGYSGLYYFNPEGLSTNQDPTKVALRRKEDMYVLRTYGYLWDADDAELKLLIKIPTRSRPENFFKMLDIYFEKLSGKVTYSFLISCDIDDETMNNQAVIDRLKNYPNLTMHFGNNTSKVEACNADLPNHSFDIVMLASDDMEPLAYDYDKIIVDEMKKHFPDTDGVLHFSDGYAGVDCNTLPILGRKFYERFGYIYNPRYKSLFCHNELALVSKILKREVHFSRILCKHNHPVWAVGEWDNLYRKNESTKESDRAIFNARRNSVFELSDDAVKSAARKKWSILICTLDEREESFKKLYDKLIAQINKLDLQDQIEVLSFKDNREHKIGFKRNALIAQSTGEYVNFLDDDDDIHDDYIGMIYNALSQNPDCVKLIGVMTTRGENPQKFIHSVKYNNSYGYQDGAYVRPPNHLSTMKRAVACQFLFPETNFAEDKNWAVRIAESGLLKNEAVIDEPYYFYYYDGKYDANHQTPENETKKSEAIPLFFCTAANSHYFNSLINLIGSIHKTNFDQLSQIAVFDIGLNPEQCTYLESIEKVKVYQIEKVHPDIIRPVFVNNWGKMVPGWYAWKPVAMKQALDMFPYVLWIDAATTVLRPLDVLFKHIKDHGYFLVTIGNEFENGAFRHPVSWQTTQYIVQKFKLTNPENKSILDYEAIGSNIWGCSKEYAHLFVDDMYELSKDLKNYADDGSTPSGFGTARHDQMILTAVAYTKNLHVFKQDYMQQNPIKLDSGEINITWYGTYVNDKTDIYSSRGDLSKQEYYRSCIRFKSKPI